ncbi:MAG: addiction module protein [Phycisphaerales bacterium JB063]
MVTNVREVYDQALRLGPVERAELVNAILSSFMPTDASIDEAWRRESAARLAAWESGELPDEPLSDVLDRINKDQP